MKYYRHILDVLNEMIPGWHFNNLYLLQFQCVNDLDYEGVPTNYVYVTSNCVTSNIPIDRSIATLQHCQCTDKCSSEDSCNCSDLSVKSWYDQDGRLKEDFDYVEPPMIFECNEMCRCNVNACYNRSGHYI